MRRSIFVLGCFLCGCFAHAQVESLAQGARITVDTLTTEITVISPSVVHVTKYVGALPVLSTPHFMPEKTAIADSLPRIEMGGKLKIDTGRFYAAVNAKDGNVSFWGHDGNLILAEQHRSASLMPSDKKDRYVAKQDFQIGKSLADSIYCPVMPAVKRKNLKGQRVEFGDKSKGLPHPYVATEKGYSILWNSPGRGYIDDTPGRQVKKPGDVTFMSPATTAIDYYFIVN